jgi:hypothetical protein
VHVPCNEGPLGLRLDIGYPRYRRMLAFACVAKNRDKIGHGTLPHRDCGYPGYCREGRMAAPGTETLRAAGEEARKAWFSASPSQGASRNDLIVPFVRAPEPLEEILLLGDPLGVPVAKDYVATCGAVIVSRIRVIFIMTGRVCS